MKRLADESQVTTSQTGKIDQQPAKKNQKEGTLTHPLWGIRKALAGSNRRAKPLSWSDEDSIQKSCFSGIWLFPGTWRWRGENVTLRRLPFRTLDGNQRPYLLELAFRSSTRRKASPDPETGVHLCGPQMGCEVDDFRWLDDRIPPIEIRQEASPTLQDPTFLRD